MANLLIDPNLSAGVAYRYLDSNKPVWRSGKAAINESTGAVYHTLHQIYQNYGAPDVAYILYNDETPEKNQSTAHGHTKGDVCFDKTQGFWLVHSVPRFPDYSMNQYSYPESGTWFGQTFLCMTLKTTDLDSIGEQLSYSHPQIYDSNLPSSFASACPQLAAVIGSDHHVKIPPWNHKADFKTSAGELFVSFAKYSKFDADIYDAWVAPTLQSALNVETWRNGGRILSTNCTSLYNVYNVNWVNMTGLPFHYLKDHSKWAVTLDSSKPWVCIGGVNRMNAQEKRPGGTVCLQNKSVWQQFMNSVTEVEKCPTI